MQSRVIDVLILYLRKTIGLRQVLCRFWQLILENVIVCLLIEIPVSEFERC